MSTALATRPRVVPCTACGENLIHYPTDQRGTVTLDAEPRLGGLYAIVKGVGHRRTLTELYQAERAGRATYGYDAHICEPPLEPSSNWWD